MRALSKCLQVVGVLVCSVIAFGAFGAAASATSPTAVEVGAALESGGIPLSVAVIDTTQASRSAAAFPNAPYTRRRVLSSAISATNDYNISITVYRSPKARRQVDRWTARNAPRLEIPREFLPLEASAKCGAIRVDLVNSRRNLDPATAVPTVREILASSYGPC